MNLDQQEVEARYLKNPNIYSKACLEKDKNILS